MQVEERRACPSCSEDNPSDAEFCWQCYARFVPVPPAPAAPQSGWGPSGTPAPGPAAGVATQTRSGGRLAKIVVGVVVALVVGIRPQPPCAALSRARVDRRATQDARRGDRPLRVRHAGRGRQRGSDHRGRSVRKRRTARHAAGARERPDVGEHRRALQLVPRRDRRGGRHDRSARGEHRLLPGRRLAMPPPVSGAGRCGRVHVARGRERRDDAGSLSGADPSEALVAAYEGTHV